MAQADFFNTVTNVLGLSDKQLEVLSDDGYDTIFNIIHWKYDKIHEWFTTKYKLKKTIREAYYGDQKLSA